MLTSISLREGIPETAPANIVTLSKVDPAAPIHLMGRGVNLIDFPEDMTIDWNDPLANTARFSFLTTVSFTGTRRNLPEGTPGFVLLGRSDVLQDGRPGRHFETTLFTRERKLGVGLVGLIASDERNFQHSGLPAESEDRILAITATMHAVNSYVNNDLQK